MAAPAVTTLALAGPNARNPGDWPCQFCKKVQFSRDISCKDCGARRPISGTYGTPLPAAEENPLQSPTGQPGDWTCPKCKSTNFARNPVCGRCNCPKPETVEEYNLLAMAAVGCLPGQHGSAKGYVPPTAQLKSDASSPWARQWCAGPVNGMFVGETNLPGWLTGANKEDGGSDSESNSQTKKRKLEAQGNAAAKAAPKGEAKKRPKIKKKYSGLSKEEIAKKKAEEEEEKRRQMRERRKDRVIKVD
ncbi:unnamed protein product [Cladocopium goreaui]|uniref:Zinc finger protein VAR3, chloroplastic (Organelle Zinc finger 1) (Protein VARIEGATED 3) n=1 Tax=Cladocopium goreaui TaxID=2562237 RepID=A0A9P1G6T8_9DINO|nr:unnamed protein product [Cladocopium goreaui]